MKEPYGIGERVSVLRKYLGFSSRPFGKQLGMSGQNLLNLERGLYKFSEKTLKQICEKFGASEDWLLTGEGPMFQPGREVPKFRPAHEIEQEEQIARMEAREAAWRERHNEILLQSAERAEYILKLRISYGVTQRELAALIGKSFSAISAFEAGRIPISDAVLGKIEEVLANRGKKLNKRLLSRELAERLSKAEMEKRIAIGERLRTARLALGKLQNDFLPELYSGAHIGRFERGECLLMDDRLEAICRASGISPTWLKTGEGEMMSDGEFGVSLNWLKTGMGSMTPSDEEERTSKMAAKDKDRKPTLGERIKAARLALRKRQKEFADAVPVASNYLSFYERDIRKPPKEVLEKLAAAWGINLQWLTDGTGVMWVDNPNAPTPLLDDFDWDHFADRLRAVRKQYHMTQADFAKAAHISMRYVTALEHSERKITPYFLEKIAANLHVSLNWLWSGKGEMFDKEAVKDVDAELATITDFFRGNDLARKMVLQAIRTNASLWLKFNEMYNTVTAELLEQGRTMAQKGAEQDG